MTTLEIRMEALCCFSTYSLSVVTIMRFEFLRYCAQNVRLFFA